MYSKAQSGVGKDIGNLPFLRRMLGLAVLVIFVLQGYAVQTHPRGLSSIGTTGVRLPTASSIFERVHAQLPGDRDPADCPSARRTYSADRSSLFLLSYRSFPSLRSVRSPLSFGLMFIGTSTAGKVESPPIR